MSKTVETFKVLGIDQSLNSTGICLHKIESVKLGDKIENLHSYKYWIIASKMTKAMRDFKNPFVSIIGYDKKVGDDYETKEIAKTLNIFSICSIIDNIIKKENPDCICMEGISYGSAGSASLVDLAGLNYCIRMFAMNRELGFKIVSPTSLKKQATGNGGAEKEEMIWAWKHCDENIKNINAVKIDDLADAFFLSKCIDIGFIP